MKSRQLFSLQKLQKGERSLVKCHVSEVETTMNDLVVVSCTKNTSAQKSENFMCLAHRFNVLSRDIASLTLQAAAAEEVTTGRHSSDRIICRMGYGEK